MTSVEIRPAAPDDDVSVVIGAAFTDHDVAALWADVVARGHARGGAVAVDGGEIVGHVGLSHAWVDARRELVDVLLLSPLSVLPDYRHQGLGGELVRWTVRAAAQQGAPALFLEGDPAYYGRLGFRPAREIGFLPPTDRVPGPAFQVVVLESFEEWMPGRLVYHDVWWEHGAAGLRDPRLAQVEDRLGRLD